MRSAAVVVLAAAALASCDLPVAPGATDAPAEVLRRKGRMIGSETVTSLIQPDRIHYDFTIRSSTGLVVRGRMRVQAGAGGEGEAGEPRPAAILLGGVERGGNAIQLLPDTLAPVVAALWYPEGLDAEDAEGALSDLDNLERVAWEIPASVLLAADYLAERPEVDPARMAVIGASFGGFFVPVAAAADPRLRNIALLYTGGDIAALLADNAPDEIPPAAATLGGEMAALRLQWIEPVRHVPALAPRHVLLVNGLHDERITRRGAEALISAVSQPKDVVWLPTAHLDPDDEPLLRALVDTALVRLPILR